MKLAVPFWVNLGVHTRMGMRLNRQKTIHQGRMEGIVAISILVASIVLYVRGWPEAPLLTILGVLALVFPFWRWQAIRWLDRHDAWSSFN